mgnify:CR=1 FL=1
MEQRGIVMPPSPYTHARLADAVESSRTLSEALLKLGVDPRSASRRYVHDRMSYMEIGRASCRERV